IARHEIACRETAGRAVAIHAVAATGRVGQRVERRVVDTRAGEEVLIVAVVAVGREVRRHIGGIRLDGDGGREVDLLPAARRFTRECSGGEAGAAAARQVANVRARVDAEFVEADASDVASGIRTELDTNLDGARIGAGGTCRRGGARPDRAWA